MQITAIPLEEAVGPTPSEWLSNPALGLVAEVRPLQVSLTEYITARIAEGAPSLIEAGTGIGKSFAYLLPAIRRAQAGERVVIATAMKSLQQQLYFKDLPYLASKVSHMPAFARQLGKKNYGCKRRVFLNVYGREAEPYEKFFDETKHWVWGDSKEALPSDHWKYGVSYCSGSRCAYYEECSEVGYLAARAESTAAQILVVNHALVGADIVVRAQHDVKILGDFKTLIIDEAHKYPEAIRGALACNMPAMFFDQAERRLTNLVREFHADIRTQMMSGNTSHIPGTLPELRDLVRTYRTMFQEAQRSDALGASAQEFAKVARKSLSALYAACGVGAPEFQKFLAGSTQVYSEVLTREMQDSPACMEVLLHLSEVADDMGRFASAIDLAQREPLRYAVAVEQSRNDPNKNALMLLPLDVGDRLVAHYADAGIVPQYMSATLALNGRFDHYALEVGHELEPGSTFLAGTPFDLKRQAWLYMPAPKVVPEPNNPRYFNAMADEIYDLLMAGEGHAFILFTSFKDMEETAAYLRRRDYPYPLLVQDAELKARGREIFLNTPNATLLGTRSFWEGIDIPGLALTLVIIPKIPFPNPSDPVIKARSARAGDEWFHQVSLPPALKDLRQMAGRLIRSTEDRGIVAILDARVHTKAYGKQVINAIGFAGNADKSVPLKLLGQLAARRRAQKVSTE